MGMYAGLRLDVFLSKNTPKEVNETLHYMLTSQPEGFKTTLEHPLFSTDRGHFMLQGTSAYLERDFLPNSSLKENRLILSFNIKNYGQEIEKFLDFISPYVGEFIRGAYQYEEMEQEIPVLFEDGKLRIKTEDAKYL
jgi:hypothetical protein